METWPVRLKRTWPWLLLPTRRSRPHSRPGSKAETPTRSAVIHSDRVACICAAQRLRSQETLSSDSLQGACADVRYSTHTGHSTDRPSHARVAESCCRFYGITSSTCQKHLGVWQAAAHAWRASALGGLTSTGRRVLRRNMWRRRTRHNANTSRAGLHNRLYGYIGRDCAIRHCARGDCGPWHHALCTPPMLMPTQWSARSLRDHISM